ncbi:DUF4259 domain-containing protein [Dyella sp. BiH032]|uniref:DUF4259 domain-containing protein n=1 Tax=Dyella sp. BiH032 TaxID=3075430 RepID=UPI0028929C02|nr:DUF4259 domain-containing protein [Dyella sp. BiH032]WNL48065.1 DUF4259 domain-containing protein [Dyella sp. BiH032]
MSAWSHESFGNDDACDFAATVSEADDLSAVEAILDVIMQVGDGYLEAPEASQAIVAAEVIARLQGNWGLRDAYSQDVDAWVERTKIVPANELALKAKRALKRITTEPSELLELWQEGDEGEKWLDAVRDLGRRVIA